MTVLLCFLFERQISWALYPKFILEHGLRINQKIRSKDAKTCDNICLLQQMIAAEFHYGYIKKSRTHTHICVPLCVCYGLHYYLIIYWQVDTTAVGKNCTVNLSKFIHNIFVDVKPQTRHVSIFSSKIWH